MRAAMAGGEPSHFTVPGVDRLAPDLKHIIDEVLFGSIWSRPGPSLQHRCISTLAVLMARGQLPLLRRQIEMYEWSWEVSVRELRISMNITTTKG